MIFLKPPSLPPIPSGPRRLQTLRGTPLLKPPISPKGPNRSLIRPFFLPLSTEVPRRAPRSLVGPQLHYLTVHLIESIAKPGLQPRFAVIGKVSGHSPRFFEKHAHVLQLR